MKTLTILILAIFTTFAGFSQSQTVLNFEEEADGYKVFLYQSLIRVMNKDKNPDFNMLIKDLDHLRLVTTDSAGAAAKQTFTELDNGIRGEGFEEILTFDNKDYKCHIFEKEGSDRKSSWVATLYMEGRAGLIEMQGSLNVKYLKAFSSLNTDMLKDMLPVEEIKNWD